MDIEYYDSLIGSGWENSYIVKDVFGNPPIKKILKDYSFAGCVLDADSTDKDLDSFILKALEKDANFIVIDFHLIPNFIRKSIDDYLKNNGYIDTKSYEFRLSYFRDNPV
jgi:hypothetical protein